MTRAEYLLQLIDEGAAGKLGGLAALGSVGVLAHKHLKKKGDGGAGDEVKKAGGNLLRKAASHATRGIETAKSISGQKARDHLGIGG